MKFTSVFALAGLFAGSLANPVPAESHLVARGSGDVDQIFLAAKAKTTAAIALCGNVDINSSLDVRVAVAAKLKADLDACATVLVNAAVDIKAKAKADIVKANGGCDDKCIEKKVKKHSEDLCKDVDVIVKKLGEDCVKDYVKPVIVNFSKLSSCLDGVFIGIGASISASVKSILSVSLTAKLGINLDADFGLGLIDSIIKIG